MQDTAHQPQVSMSSFKPVSEILTNNHKQQTFSDIYGEPENFLEIEVCHIFSPRSPS